MSVHIVTGDCRIVLQQESAAVYDLCIADPPYGDTALSWDQKVKGWIPAVARAIKPNGSLWVFGSMRFLAPLFSELEAEEFKYAQDIVWEKQNGTGFHADRFKRVHEHAVQFYRGAWADVYKCPQFSNDARERKVIRRNRPAHFGHINDGAYETELGGPRFLRSVFYEKNQHRNAIHPTQKPVDVVLPLIRYSCPPGGAILSPFGGSGTDALAAKIAGCNALLIELDPEMADKARYRLANDAPLLTESAA